MVFLPEILYTSNMHVWPWSITFLLRGTSLLSCTVQTNAIPQLNALSHLMPFVQPSPQQPGSTVPLAPSRTSSSSTNRGPVLRSTSTYRTAGQGPQGAAHLPSRDSMRKRAVTAAASVIGSAAAAAVPTQLHHHYQVQQAGGGDEGRSAPATKVNRHQHHHYQSQQQLQCHEDQHDNLHQQQQQQHDRPDHEDQQPHTQQFVHSSVAPSQACTQSGSTAPMHYASSKSSPDVSQAPAPIVLLPPPHQHATASYQTHEPPPLPQEQPVGPHDARCKLQQPPLLSPQRAHGAANFSSRPASTASSTWSTAVKVRYRRRHDLRCAW